MESLSEKMLAAAQEGDWGAVSEWAAQGADVNYRDAAGYTVAFIAAWEGNTKALDLLYDLGANLVFEEANLLCNAAFNGKAVSVQWLLEKGADADFIFADTGENALHYTICKTSEMDERVEIVKLLIAAGTSVHQKTITGSSTLCFMRDAYLKGETPLHRAAAYGNTAMVKILLDAGADPSIKDANGDTPISWGSWFLRDAEVLRLLLYDGVPRIG